ncbi:MAG: HAMP domain-containing sensor histidine kinase [Vicinamibacterales bacterium]
MARPFREQFAVATLVLLVPVSAIMVWAANRTYQAQLAALDVEASRLAAAIVAHVEHADVATGADLVPFLMAMDRGPSVITVRDAQAGVVVECRSSAAGGTGQCLAGAALPPPPVELTGPQPQDVSRLGWKVQVQFPNGIAYQAMTPIYYRTIAIAGLATLIVLGFEALFVRRYLRSFTRLERAADRVGQGDLRTPPREPMPSRELEHVRDAFRDMVDKLRDAREAIARQVEEERRMRREVEMLQQQVIRQERLAAIGLLLSGIAHELNNPLQAISGFAELLQRDPDVRADVRDDLALIQKESARASGIIRNLSRFSRQQHTSPTTVYLTDVVASVVELRQRRMQEQGVQLTVEERATRPVTAVHTELQQVLLNFVVNAEQAFGVVAPGDRRIAIRTRDTADGVELQVEDSGPGVLPEDESKLFQPFFTTKPVGEGTGLGLSVSYGIIQSFGGTIGYRRGAMGGALFHFELPSPPDPPRRTS